MRMLKDPKQLKRPTEDERGDRPERNLLVEMLPLNEPLRVPEHRLCFKMIVLAMLDLLQIHSRPVFADAWRWVYRGDPRDDCSFVFCCQHLGLEVGPLRESITQLIKLPGGQKRAVRRALRSIFSATL